MTLFVSYTYRGLSHQEFGWTTVQVDAVETESDIEDMIEKVKEQLNQDGVKILNWKKL